jgi:hypothetical protein
MKIVQLSIYSATCIFMLLVESNESVQKASKDTNNEMLLRLDENSCTMGTDRSLYQKSVSA